MDDFATLSWADKERDTSAWLGNEMQQIVAAAGGAFAVANPVFVIVLACTTAATLVLISAATLVALSWLV